MLKLGQVYVHQMLDQILNESEELASFTIQALKMIVERIQAKKLER